MYCLSVNGVLHIVGSIVASYANKQPNKQTHCQMFILMSQKLIQLADCPNSTNYTSAKLGVIGQLVTRWRNSAWQRTQLFVSNLKHPIPSANLFLTGGKPLTIN